MNILCLTVDVEAEKATLIPATAVQSHRNQQECAEIKLSLADAGAEGHVTLCITSMGRDTTRFDNPYVIILKSSF
jgi:hypothetical protein